MALTPKERAHAKHAAKHGRRHHEDPRKVAHDRVLAQLRAGGYRGGVGVSYGISAYSDPAVGAVTSVTPQSGHLSPEQFVGFPGGFSTDAGNYTGVQAIEGAAGNGGAGGASSGGDSGGAPS